MIDERIIAIIDDDLMVRESLQRLISSIGLRAQQFSSPEEFLALVAYRNIGCIVSDVNVDAGGAEHLQHRLAALGRTIPIIFMTALPHSNLRQRLLADGAVGVLTKPFRQHEITSCIAAALKSSDVEAPTKNPTRSTGGAAGQTVAAEGKAL